MSEDKNIEPKTPNMEVRREDRIQNIDRFDTSDFTSSFVIPCSEFSVHLLFFNKKHIRREVIGVAALVLSAHKGTERIYSERAFGLFNCT